MDPQNLSSSVRRRTLVDDEGARGGRLPSPCSVRGKEWLANAEENPIGRVVSSMACMHVACISQVRKWQGRQETTRNKI